MDDQRVPQRIRLSRKKGWRLPDNAKSCARPGRYGNPWRVGHPQPLALPGERYKVVPDQPVLLPITNLIAVDLFRRSLFAGFLRFDITEVVDRLAGWDLGCWCAETDPCHVDVLLAVANHGLTTAPSLFEQAPEDMQELARDLSTNGVGYVTWTTTANGVDQPPFTT